MKKSNITKHTSLLSSALATLFLLTPCVSALALDKDALPAGENVIGGSASFDRSTSGTLNITQNTDRLLIEWNKGFDIGKNATTNFYQPSNNSIVVNRVTDKTTSPTHIYGSLNANGKVIILNQDGIVFDKTARIDVGGLIASTGTLNDKAFLAGDHRLQLENFSSGSVKNSGSITVADAGLAALVAPTARNDGVITAKLGTVVMGSAKTVTLDLYGDSLFEVTTGQDLDKTNITNTGEIDVSGGKILLPAALVDNVITHIVNMEGVEQGNSFKVVNGKIILGKATKYVAPSAVVTPPPSPAPVVAEQESAVEPTPEAAPIIAVPEPFTPAEAEIPIAAEPIAAEPQYSIILEEASLQSASEILLSSPAPAITPAAQLGNKDVLTSWLRFLFYNQSSGSITLDDIERLRTVTRPEEPKYPLPASES